MICHFPVLKTGLGTTVFLMKVFCSAVGSLPKSECGAIVQGGDVDGAATAAADDDEGDDDDQIHNATLQAWSGPLINQQ